MTAGVSSGVDFGVGAEGVPVADMNELLKRSSKLQVCVLS